MLCSLGNLQGHDRRISGDTICHDLLVRLDTIISIELDSIWSKHRDTSSRFGTRVYVQIRRYTLRYFRHDRCAVAMGRENDGNSFRWITIIATIRPRQRIYTTRLTISTHRNWTHRSLNVCLLQDACKCRSRSSWVRGRGWNATCCA